jgi:hypothetical protein
LREGEILFYQETLFIWGSKRYVKEDSGSGHISPRGPCWVTWRGFHFNVDFERQMEEDSGNEASLSTGTLRGEPGVRAP